MNRDHLSGVLWTIASTVMFSLMTLFARLAHDWAGLGAWKTVEIRCLFSMAAVIVLSVLLRQPLRFVNRWWLVSRGLFGAMAVVLFFFAINIIGVAKATILVYTCPMWAGLLSPMLLGDRVGKGLWASVVVVFIGLYLIIVPPGGFTGVSWFDLLALSGGLLSGIAVLSVKRLRETDSTMAILFSQAFFGWLIAGVPAACEGYAISPLGWVLLIALSIFAVAGQMQMTYAYKHVGGTEGALLGTLTPVFNVFIGLFMFNEEVGARGLVGCGVVLAGCIYAALPPRVPPALAEAEASDRLT
jgi:drug/metabolite transporter (DMT)-like permease